MEKETSEKNEKDPGAQSVAGSENDAREQLLRLRADFENAKKRMERDKADAIRFGNERLLAEVLEAVDNFDRAVKSLDEGHDGAKVRDGLHLAQDQLHKTLQRHGVEVIESVGKEFDPQLHEAVASVETSDAKDGFVLDEVQRGYLLNGRLLRPSRVRIAKTKSEE